MGKKFKPLVPSKNIITHLHDVFIHFKQNNIFKVLEKYHQILVKEKMVAAPDKSQFFLTRVKLIGHIRERNTITPLLSRFIPKLKLQPPSNEKKIQVFLEMLKFSSKYVLKM